MKPLLRYFSCVLRVIVLLEGKPSAQSEVLSTLEKVFVQDIPVLGHIHLSLDCNQHASLLGLYWTGDEQCLVFSTHTA